MADRACTISRTSVLNDGIQLTLFCGDMPPSLSRNTYQQEVDGMACHIQLDEEHWLNANR
jgi:hypothetical protein